MNRFVALCLALLLAACGGQAGQPAGDPPLAGARIGGPFTLTDQNGKSVTDRSLAGKYRIVYFGYTYCPDVCPVDMQIIAAAMKALDSSAPATAAKIVPLFISVDPDRDTAAVLKQFAAAFDPRVVALRGTPEQTAAVAKAYGIYFAKQKPGAGGGYMVDHSRQVYLMDPDGKPLALLPADKGTDAMVAELKRWVR